jgi:hypothetical protein
MVAWLARRGWHVTVLDNLSTGHRRAVPDGDLLHADLLEPSSLERVFGSRHVDAVMHFCARSLVAESVKQPYDYYANNVAGTLNLLQVMRRHAIKQLVFSSTAAVFGRPADRPDRRRAAQGADQSLRCQQADGGAHAGGRGGCLRSVLGVAALFQRRGRQHGRFHWRVARSSGRGHDASGGASPYCSGLPLMWRSPHP